jgi:hypothetical protein
MPALDPPLHLPPELVQFPSEEDGHGGEKRHTSAFVTILQVPWRAIVAGRYHPPLPNQHAAHPTLHAIAPLGGKGGQLHEVLVPGRPQALFIRQVQAVEDLVETLDGGCRVHQADFGPVYEHGEAANRVVKMGVVLDHELL